MIVPSSLLLSFIAVLATPGLVEARSIGVRKACFNFGEAIEIDFDNTALSGPEPDLDDWIGLTGPNGLDIASLDPQPIMWTWACGDQDCAFAVLGGTVVFGPSQPDESGIDSWPLDAGEYVAFLTGGVSPYQARALSINFRVMPEGQFCSGTQPEQQNNPFTTENNPISTHIPTKVPTPTPTRVPTRAPTKAPTPVLMQKRTAAPTRHPSPAPTPAPTQKRTSAPTRPPTPTPTPAPTQKHTPAPTRPSSPAPTPVPMQKRTSAPTRPPTPTPTPAPSPVPTPEPTDSIVVVTPDKVVVSERSGMSRVIRNARNDIRRIIASERRLAPKFLRLVFHDCVGGCDGCVDMKNADNAGLDFPIAALDPIVNKYASRGLSRTDIWTLSAIVASDVLQPSDESIHWPFQWIGRKTCAELNNNVCRDESDQRTRCAEDRGPHRHLPHADIGTGTIADFFSKEFGWNGQQTAAIMGAHSVGSMRRRTLGFDGDWDLTNDVLDNGYYIELVGNEREDAPNFRQVVVRNSDLRSIPNRLQFEAINKGQRVSMLTADIAMARQLEEDVNLRSDGAVLCSFKGSNRCPDAQLFVEHMRRYSRNTGVFLEDFRDVMYLMIDHGYRRKGKCPRGEICVLEAN